MKRFALIALTLVSAACSTQNNDSATNGVPGSPVLMPALKLSCIETATFSDLPGREHALSIREMLGTATAKSRTISKEGNGEWEFGQLGYIVEQSSEEGAVTYSLKEAVDLKVDWKTEGSCFKPVAQQSYTVRRDAEGNWMGEAELIGHLLINPAAICDVPHIARPPVYALACTEL